MTMISLTVFAILMASNCGLGSSISIDIITSDSVRNTMTIKCTVRTKEGCDRANTILQLSKNNNKQLVSLQSQDKLHFGCYLKDSELVNAIGHLGDDTSDSYLNFTIYNVTKEENAGMYTCSMFYLDSSGHMNHEIATATVIINDDDAKNVKINIQKDIKGDQQHNYGDSENVINNIMELVKDFEETHTDVLSETTPNGDQTGDHNSHCGNQIDIESVKKQMEHIRELQAKTDYLEKLLSTQQSQIWQQAETVSTKIKILEEMENNNSQTFKESVDKVMKDNGNIQKQLVRVQDFMDKENSLIAFSYAYNDTTRFQSEGTLHFNEPILNLGGAYNPKTGKFIAPMDGLYVFHIAIRTYHNGVWTNVHLTVNDKFVASIHAIDNYSSDQSSTSTVVVMKKGDVLRPVVWGPGNQYIFHNDYFSLLTGYLLRPL